MNEVKVYDANGLLKTTITRKEVIDKMWKDMGVNPYGNKPAEESPLKQCAWCDAEFRPLLTTASKRAKFCSRKCRVSSSKEKNKTKLVELKCRKCDKLFMGTPSRVYCNEPCSHLKTGIPIPKRDCATCGTEFQPKSNRGKYCGKPCTYWNAK